MKRSKIFYLIIIIGCIRTMGYAQNKITFQYDAKGNQVSAKYTGSKPCKTEANPLIIENSDQRSVQASNFIEKANLELLELHIFPNPSLDKIRIESSLPYNEKGKIYIINPQGKVLEECNLDVENVVDYDLKNLPSGRYNCVLIYKNKSITESFIKL